MTDTQRGNLLGPYRLKAKYRDTEDTGRIYRAYNVVTGAPALVLQRSARQVVDQPLADWQVCVTSSVSPSFVALEVMNVPTTGDRVDVPEELVFMLEDAADIAHAVLDKPETLPHLRAAPRPPLARPAPEQRVSKIRNFETRPSSSWRRPSLAAGLAAAAAAVLLHLGGSGSGTELRHDAGAELAHADVDAGWPWDDASIATGLVLTDSADDLPIVLARAMPKKPFEQQKRPPCNRNIETELFNGCWVATDKPTPCPDELYEFEGKCYLPAAKPTKRNAAFSRQPLAFDRP